MSSQAESTPRSPFITLESLIDAARKEDWEVVDESIPGISDEPKFVSWALSDGMEDSDGNLRDLAVSILEKSAHELKQNQIDKIRKLMEIDDNPHVQFRSSFALFTHGQRTPDVIAKLQGALQDEEVKDIAQEYLDQLK